LRAAQFIKDNKMAALWVDMGLGKTVSTLTALVDLLATKQVIKVLVVAPLRVAQHTWPTEINNWEHLKALKFSVLAGLGPAKREQAAHSSAPIHIVNRENLPWLIDFLGSEWRYDTVVIDESSSFKSHSSQRWKALRKVVKANKINRMVQLTGTPAPNSLMELWPQIYLLDRGSRLGDTRGKFLDNYCRPIGNPQWSQYEMRHDKVDQLHGKVADLVLRMDSKDYLELPDRIDSNIVVPLPQKALRAYQQMEKDFIIEIENGEVLAANAAVKVNKLLQICSGAVYTEQGHEVLHDAKLDALQEIIESSNEPVLVAYNFKIDAARIAKRIKGAELLKSDPKILDRWNKKEVSVLLAHPASAGHGLNLQAGGSIIVWFGIPWSLELYQQFNARLHRQGQKNPVRIIHILADVKADWVVKEVLKQKGSTQDLLLKMVDKQGLSC
jgi:SNF2 family DNA or RNA helicase